MISSIATRVPRRNANILRGIFDVLAAATLTTLSQIGYSH
jgi:hypothetical protein